MEEKEIINEISVSNVEPIALFHSIPCTSEVINEDNERVIEVQKERVGEEFKNHNYIIKKISESSDLLSKIL